MSKQLLKAYIREIIRETLESESPFIQFLRRMDPDLVQRAEDETLGLTDDALTDELRAAEEAEHDWQESGRDERRARGLVRDTERLDILRIAAALRGLKVQPGLRRIIKETLQAEKKLRVFDLDDTLVITNSKVHITKASGELIHLTPAEYAVYEKEPGDNFDYSDFHGLVDPKAIGWTTKILKRVINKHGTDAAVILTARGSEEPAREFFRINNIPEIPVVALGNSDPELKAQWIKMVAMKFGYKEIEFFDDSPKNIAAVKKIHVPGVKIIARHIVH